MDEDNEVSKNQKITADEEIAALKQRVAQLEENVRQNNLEIARLARLIEMTAEGDTELLEAIAVECRKTLTEPSVIKRRIQDEITGYLGQKIG